MTMPHPKLLPITVGKPDAAEVARDVARSLAEDIGSGDLSAQLVSADARSHAHVLLRDDAVVAGQAWFDACFHALDPESRVSWSCHDGAHVTAGTVLCSIEANARALLSAERSALNFLQTLSGTATTTANFVAILGDSKTRILDTRKTLPGLRYAQKYAVKVGGGENHRRGLFDAILIKENHIIAAGGIAAAITRARALAPEVMVEIEVENLDEFRLSLAARPDRIMLDEFSDADLREAIRLRPVGIELEISGSVSAQRLADLARLGVDYISIGALTKHVRAVDLSLRWT